MAFNIIDYLRDGKVDFVFRLTPYDFDSTVKLVRQLDNRIEVINGFLKKLLDENSRFCFEIIYDIEEFKDSTKHLLDKGLQLDEDKILNLFKNTRWGKEYIYQHIEELLPVLSEEKTNELFNYIFTHFNECQDFVKYFRLCKNLHYRYLFMKYLIENYIDLFKIIYPNFLECLTSVTYEQYEQLTFLPDYMSNEDICSLAYVILKSPLKSEYFEPLKEFILRNYPENDLAKELLEPRKEKISEYSYRLIRDEEAFDEFEKDADRLFISSATERFFICRNYPLLISNEIIEQYLDFYSRFRSDDNDVVSIIHIHRLEQKLREFIDRYLSISRDKTWSYIASGTTGTVYRMGDYVLKLFRTKWSYEDVICPDLYLIVKNLEQIYIRDSRGIVEAGIEVQPYLKNSAEFVSPNTLVKFVEELKRLGYVTTDTLIGGTCGDNCRLLDSYRDANCRNPEKLPRWFKKEPIVLVDRDRVYEKDRVYIKQLSSGY